MNIILTKSAWKAADLDGKTVEFRIVQAHKTSAGVGKFLAADCPDELLSLSIVVDQTLITGKSWAQHRYQLSQGDVDCIEIHPIPEVARFRLLSKS